MSDADPLPEIASSGLPGEQRSPLTEGSKRGATRRDALAWLGALGVGVVPGESILAGAGAAVAQAPKSGGVLRVAMHTGGATETMDPAKQANAIDYPRARMFFNALTRIGASGAAEPEIAEGFEPSPDGREWTFRLRAGVEFHDGKTLTSDDVVYSLMRHKDPATASTAKVLMEQVESVVADGSSVVRIRLTAPNADLPLVLGTTQFVIVQDGAKDFLKPAGTGPFRLDQTFAPGSRTIGKRFANYFKDGRPYLDELHLFVIPDGNARANALFSGDIDAATNLGPVILDQIASRPDLAILNTESGAFGQFAMMCDRKPTDNADMRLAVKHLLDRERFLKTVQRGFGQLGNDHPVPPNHPMYNAELPQRSLDVDKAEFHLRRAGMKGSRAELYVSDGAPGTIEMGQMFQQAAARAGLSIDLKREPADGYYPNYWMKKPFVGNRWQARPTIDIMLSLGWLSSAKWNDTSLSDPALDRLVIAARGEIEPAKRRRIYGDIQKLIHDQGGNAIYSFVNFRDALNAKVRGIEPNPLAELGGYYFPDTAWLDA